MFRTIAFVPGGQPIGALERWFAKIGQRVIALFRRVGIGRSAT
jgi:lipopolysaccharide export system permease protein